MGGRFVPAGAGVGVRPRGTAARSGAGLVDCATSPLRPRGDGITDLQRVPDPDGADRPGDGRSRGAGIGFRGDRPRSTRRRGGRAAHRLGCPVDRALAHRPAALGRRAWHATPAARLAGRAGFQCDWSGHDIGHLPRPVVPAGGGHQAHRRARGERRPAAGGRTCLGAVLDDGGDPPSPAGRLASLCAADRGRGWTDHGHRRSQPTAVERTGLVPGGSARRHGHGAFRQRRDRVGGCGRRRAGLVVPPSGAR